MVSGQRSPPLCVNLSATNSLAGVVLRRCLSNLEDKSQDGQFPILIGGVARPADSQLGGRLAKTIAFPPPNLRASHLVQNRNLVQLVAQTIEVVIRAGQLLIAEWPVWTGHGVKVTQPP